MPGPRRLLRLDEREPPTLLISRLFRTTRRASAGAPREPTPLLRPWKRGSEDLAAPFHADGRPPASGVTRTAGYCFAGGADRGRGREASPSLRAGGILNGRACCSRKAQPGRDSQTPEEGSCPSCCSM